MPGGATETHPVAALRRLSRSFGAPHTSAKIALLNRIDRLPRLGARWMRELQDVLCFVRAYPDDGPLRRRAERSVAALRARVEVLRRRGAADALVNTGLPGSHNSYAYTYRVVVELVRSMPDCLDVDWDELEDQTALLDGVGLLVGAGEYQGLEDIRRSMQSWVASCKTSPDVTDLGLILDLFERSAYDAREREYILDACDLPIRYELTRPGTGKCELIAPTRRIHHQRHSIEKEAFALAPRIRRAMTRPERLPAAQGGQLIELALRTLCCRNLEIYTLSHADPNDVSLVECGRGLAIAVVGVLPDMRSPLESLQFVLILKNGVPIGYGPAAVCGGCCEMGLNLFPEFRGGEVRFVYAQFMRVLHHLLSVETFFLTSYGMGEENPEAIRSGAFWFYRKLGFQVTNPEVESLARLEEERIRARPDHRSSAATLRRLSRTEAWFSLGAEPRRPIDLGALGMAESRYVASRFGGDRSRAVRASLATVRRALGISRLDDWTPDQRRALTVLALVLAMLPGLARWSAADRRRLVRFVRGKGAASESEAARLLARSRRLIEELRRLTSSRR